MTHYVHTGTVRDRSARQASLLKGQTMTRRHRLAYVHGLDAISSGGVSTGSWFRSVAKPDLHQAMLVVTHIQELLGLLRAGRGSIW